MREFSLDDLLPHLLYQFESEHELIKSILEVSDAFTVNRHKIHAYLQDPRLISAYTLFYLATNIPKLHSVINLLGIDFKNDHLIDVGAGPGTFSLAWINLFGGSVVTQIETSTLMKEQSLKLFQAFFPHVKIASTLNEKSQSLMLFGHSLNEMGFLQGLKYVLKFQPEKVLLIEPGTKESFRICLDFREQMIKSGYFISYPCQNQNACGLQHDLSNWCHQIIEVRHHPSIERITQMAKKDRRRLPLIIQFYEKTSSKKSETILFRVLKETKHSFEWEVCQENKIEKWQIEKKGLTKEEQKSLSLYGPGQKISAETVKEMDSLKRVKLLNKI